MSASARRNEVISIAPILVRLNRILHNNGTATAVLAIPVPPPLDERWMPSDVSALESQAEPLDTLSWSSSSMSLYSVLYVLISSL